MPLHQTYLTNYTYATPADRQTNDHLSFGEAGVRPHATPADGQTKDHLSFGEAGVRPYATPADRQTNNLPLSLGESLSRFFSGSWGEVELVQERSLAMRQNGGRALAPCVERFLAPALSLVLSWRMIPHLCGTEEKKVHPRG